MERNSILNFLIFRASIGLGIIILLCIASSCGNAEKGVQPDKIEKNEREIIYDDNTIDGNHSPWTDRTGGQLAVVFTPTFYPAVLTKVRFFVSYAGIPVTDFGVRVYGGTTEAGPDDSDLLTTEVTASAEASLGLEWVEVDLSDQNIIITSGDFCVAMEWLTPPGGDGEDAQFIGVDYTQPDRRSWWKTDSSSNWKRIEEVELDIDRDFMIRAAISKGEVHQFVQEINFPVLKGSYLGQKPPGDTPEVFAPGMISTKATEGGSSFSPDGSFYLFARARSVLNGILMMQQVDGIWSKPSLASFSAGEYDWDFMLAPDGKTVYVASGRPISEGGPAEHDHRIWMSERSDGDWSKPHVLPFPVNSGQHDSYPSVTEEGTLYFFSRRSGGLGQGDIYRSSKRNGQFTDIENLGEPINTKHHEVDPFISPDESYIIFCSDKPDGFGKDDFYISFRRKNGSWSVPINMGSKINSEYQEYIPYVTPDSKYFFFTSNKSGNRDIYWISAEIIKNLKPEELK